VILLGRKAARGGAVLTRIAHHSSGDFMETPVGPCRLGGLIGPITGLI